MPRRRSSPHPARRRTSPGRALAGAALGALASSACDGPVPTLAPDGAPNVLLVSIDTLRADHLGLYGYAPPTSPELDRFAETAVVFDAAQASASWTLPGLASIFSSTYTSTNGTWNFATRLDDSFTTMTEALLANGYDTACVVSHIYCTPSYGLTQGFVHIDDGLATPEVDPDLVTTSHQISDRGIEFMERKEAAPDGKPWFLWLHYFDPHGTYMPQEGYTELFTEGDGAPNELALYDGEIAYTDHHVGRVFDALDELGLAGNTVVIVVADHGEEFFDHGGHDHGHALYAELIRVPLLIRAPGIAPRRVGEVVRTVDLFPTVMDLAGLAWETPEGRSVRAAMNGAALAPEPALSEVRLNPMHEFESVIDGRYKLIRRHDPQRVQLYDLEEDPGEKVNLKGERLELLEEMTRKLDALMEEAAEKAAAFQQGVRGDLTADDVDALSKLGYVETEDEATPLPSEEGE